MVCLEECDLSPLVLQLVLWFIHGRIALKGTSFTQSYVNSLWGDVVLDTFNNVSRDEDNILNHIYIYIYIANMFGLLLWGFKILKVIEENAIFKEIQLSTRKSS